MRSVGDFSELDAIGGGGDMSVFDMVENAIDLSSNPDGTVTSGVVKPVDPAQKTEDRDAIPEWGQTLTGRVDGLEKEMRQGFAGINAKLDKLSGSSQQPTAQGTVSPPGTDTGRFG